jgi:hypothetical protein
MSQFREDEHIESVFNEIGYGSRILCDIGARLAGSNSENLIRKHEFTGVLVDASKESCAELKRAFPAMRIVESTVTPQDVNSLVPEDCWFFSLDIDSYDWFVWAAMTVRPALVVVETNPLPILFAAKPNAARKDKNGYGMSVSAAVALGNLKGYDYIGRTEVNAFFTRKELKCQFRLPAMTVHNGIPCKAQNNVLHG